MKKALILLLFAILLSVNGYALIEKYNGKAYNNGEIVINEQKFNFKISDASKRIIASNNDKVLIIGNNECGNVINFKICAYNITSGFDDQDEADVIIYYYAANLTINRTQDKTEVETGDSIKFKVSITNTGDFIAKSIFYTDYFPDNLLIEKIDGNCNMHDNSIEYSGELRRSEKAECSYKITPRKEADLTLRAEINYFDGNEDKKEYSNTIQIISTPLFAIKPYVYENIDENTTEYTLLESSKLNIGEKFNLMINLSNLVSDTLKFENFTIIFPEGFEIISSNLIKTNEGAYIFKGELDNGTSKEFYFTITPKVGDSLKLVFLSDLKKGKKEVKGIENIVDFSIESKDIELSSSLDETNKFDSGKEITISFYAKNNNLYNDLTIINANLISPLFPNINLPKMVVRKNSTLMIYKTSFVPKNESESYKLNLETRYSNQENKIKVLKKDWTATVQKINEIEITKSFPSTTIEEEEEAEIIVSVKNTRTQPIYNVKVNEIFKTPITYNGKTKAIIDLIKPDEKIEVYTYNIKAPKAKNGTIIEIDTNLSYTEDAYDEYTINSNSSINVFKQINITVEPRRPDLKITKTSARSKLKIGETQDVKYTLKNNDKKTIYDINIYFSKSSNVDIVGENYHFIKKIDPLEEINFIEEKVRPKKEGTINAGETMIELFDDGNNFFNYTSSSLSFEVVNTTDSIPLIFISKSVNTTLAVEDNIVNVTLIVENKGFTGADVKVIDNFREFEIYAYPESKSNFSYLRSIGKKDEYTPKLNAYYSFNGKDFEAYGIGNKIEVTEKAVETESETPIVNDVIPDYVLNPVTEGENKEIAKSESFFQKIINKIKSLFGSA